MTKNKPKFDVFKNGIPYARFGKGKKILLVWWGGPGNDVPKGFALNMIKKGLKPFEEEYTIYFMTRKSGLIEGYTTKNMSDDYAELIKEEFSGKVDLIIGISYGGVILQHFAADYPDMCRQVVMTMAAHEVCEEGKVLDYKFAELRSKGKNSKAYALIAEALFQKGIKRSLLKILLRIMGLFIGKPESETFSKDIMIEAMAELAHHSVESLKRIKIPVLILGGDKDYYFPAHHYEKTASLIPNSILKLYPGKGHDIIQDKRFAEDIMEFIN